MGRAGRSTSRSVQSERGRSASPNSGSAARLQPEAEGKRAGGEAPLGVDSGRRRPVDRRPVRGTRLGYRRPGSPSGLRPTRMDRFSSKRPSMSQVSKLLLGHPGTASGEPNSREVIGGPPGARTPWTPWTFRLHSCGSERATSDSLGHLGRLESGHDCIGTSWPADVRHLQARPGRRAG